MTEDKKQEKVKSKSVIDRFFTAFYNWERVLLGKPKVNLEKMNSVVQKAKDEPEEAEEDSVKEDVEKAKELLSKLAKKASEKSGPISQKGKDVTGTAVSNASNFANRSPVKKLLIIVPLMIVVIGFLAIFANTFLFKTGRPDVPDGPVISPTSGELPTVNPLQPFKPSIYANDEEVLKLEEDLNFFKKDVISTDIRLPELIPPTLSFLVQFAN